MDGDEESRRRFLRRGTVVATLGLAGCSGDGDTAPTTPSASATGTTETTGTGTVTTGTTGTADTPPPTSDTSGPTDTTPGESTPSETPTRTGTPEQLLGDDPSPLLSIEGESIQAGDTTTLTGTLTNPYPFPVRSVAVALAPPNGDWAVSTAGETSVDSITPGESHGVAWDVTAPESASGAHTLVATVSYATESDQADVTVEHPVVAATAGVAPIGVDCGGVHTADTVTVDGLSFLPEAAFTGDLDIEGTNMVGGIPERARWWTADDAVDIDPAPNAGVFDTAIDGTDHDDLYRTEHWYGPTDDRYDEDNPLTYTFGLPNGTYDVTLHFAEVWFGGPAEGGEGRKVFTVEINGEPVLEEFDIYAEAGYATALTRTFEVEVTDGELTITAIRIVHNPRFNAIEIREA
jgi:hypothetical protein